MPEERRNTDTLSTSISKYINEFGHGYHLFMYYKYLDKFKTEPASWKDLYEFMDYNVCDMKIEELSRPSDGGK